MDIAPDGTVSVRQGAGAANWVVVNPASADEVVEPVAIPNSAITAVSQATVPAQYAAALSHAAAAANISPALLSALVWQESRWRPQVVSRAGAIGLAQLMPGTARDLGVNPTDPVANLHGGARYLRQLLDQFGGNVEKALAAYNAGAARVRSAGVLRAVSASAARPRMVFIGFLRWSSMRFDARSRLHKPASRRWPGFRRHFERVRVRRCRRRAPFPHFHQIDQGVGEDIAPRRQDWQGGRPG